MIHVLSDELSTPLRSGWKDRKLCDSLRQESRGQGNLQLDSRGGCRRDEKRRVWTALRVIRHALAGLIGTSTLRDHVTRRRTDGRTIPRWRAIDERTTAYRTTPTRHAVSRRERSPTVVPATTAAVVPSHTSATTSATTSAATLVANDSATRVTAATSVAAAASFPILHRSLALTRLTHLLSTRDLLLTLCLLVRLRALLLLNTGLLSSSMILILVILLRRVYLRLRYWVE